MTLRSLIFTLIIMSISAAAFADETIILDDGKSYTGKIIIETPERIVLSTPKGKVTLDKSFIKERRKALSPRQQFRKRASALVEEDVDEWRKLARWCLEQGLKAEAYRCYEQVLKTSPQDTEARAALAKRAAAKQAEGAAETEEDKARRLLRAELAATTVHFDFQRATIETIVTALGRAAEVSIRIDKEARKDLKKRKLRMRYKTDNSALSVLSDLSEHGRLDFIINTEEVVIGTPRSIKALRKKLGLKKKSRPNLSADEAREALENSRHTLRCDKKRLRSVMTYLKTNTPLNYLYDGPAEALDEKVSFETFERPLRTVLERALNPVGLSFMLQGNVIYIASPKKIAEMIGEDDD